jgi:hypothetical protein
MKIWRLFPTALAALLTSACHDGSITVPDAHTPAGPARDGVILIGSGNAFGSETSIESDTTGRGVTMLGSGTMYMGRTSYPTPTAAGDTTGRGVNMMGNGHSFGSTEWGATPTVTGDATDRGVNMFGSGG